MATTDRKTSLLLSGQPEPWQAADLVTWGPARHPTDFQALWNEQALYLRFDAADPEPWHRLKDRDDPLWEEEVVEIFLDPNRSGRNYAELEISPGNVVCDLRMISGEPEKRMDISWDLEGLESRVEIRRAYRGEITGWTAIAALPWSGFRSLPSAGTVSLPPRSGDRWRFNLFRIERPGGPAAPDEGVVFAPWSPPPGASFHVPEVFRDLVFVKGDE